MSAKRDDLDKIGDVLLEFFKTQRIRETLDSIHKFGVTGWEKGDEGGVLSLIPFFARAKKGMRCRAPPAYCSLHLHIGRMISG